MMQLDTEQSPHTLDGFIDGEVISTDDNLAESSQLVDKVDPIISTIWNTSPISSPIF